MGGEGGQVHQEFPDNLCKTPMNTHPTPLRTALTRRLFTLLSAAMLAVLGAGAQAQLYVVETGDIRVGTYNASSGAVLNASFIPGFLQRFGLELYGNDLFVSSL